MYVLFKLVICLKNFKNADMIIFDFSGSYILGFGWWEGIY